MPVENIFRELQVQYPEIAGMSLTSGFKVSNDRTSEGNGIVALIDAATELDAETVSRIKNWLKVRLDAGAVNVLISRL